MTYLMIVIITVSGVMLFCIVSIICKVRYDYANIVAQRNHINELNNSINHNEVNHTTMHDIATHEIIESDTPYHQTINLDESKTINLIPIKYGSNSQ